MQHLKPSYYLFIDLEPSKTCKIFMHINCYKNKKKHYMQYLQGRNKT